VKQQKKKFRVFSISRVAADIYDQNMAHWASEISIHIHHLEDVIMRSIKKTLGVFLGISTFLVVVSFAGHSGGGSLPMHTDQIIAGDGLPPPLPPPAPPPDDPTLA
jgi:hypothetical protein